MTSSSKRVTILHPWLPQYRLAFFESLISRLEAESIEVTVAHGSPPPEVSLRNDARSAAWATEMPTWYVPLGKGRPLTWHGVKGLLEGRDLIIGEQVLRNLEQYPLLLNSRLRRPRYAFWGHGRTYTKAHSNLEIRAKTLVTNQAHWFFAYTEGGAEYVVQHGFPQDRVTVVQNAIETEQIRSDALAASDEDRLDVRARLRLPVGPYDLYIGGLDSSKRIDMLLDAGKLIHASCPDFRLVVAGAGPLAGLVEDRATTAKWLTYVGPVFGRDKAILASGAHAMLIPGRVGLAVVDAFATSTPVVASDWEFHAPEFEYLVHEVNSLVSPDSTGGFADTAIRLWRDSALHASLARGASASAERYTLSAMVDNFARGLHLALARS